MRLLSFFFRVSILLVFYLSPIVSYASTQEINFFNPNKNKQYGNFLAGIYALQQFEDEDAISYFQNALRGDKKSLVILKELFYTYLLNGEIKKASSIVGKSLKLNDNLSNIQFVVRGTEKFNLKKFKSAQKVFEQIKGFPSLENWNYQNNSILKQVLLAWSYAGSKKIDAALQALDNIDDQEFIKGYIDFHRALICDYLGDSRAENFYITAIETKSSMQSRVYLYYAHFLTESGDNLNAKKLLESYSSESQSDLNINWAIKNFQEFSKEDYFKAKPNRAVAESFFLNANLLYDRDPISTLSFLQLASFLDENFYEPKLLIAEIYETNELYSRAIEYYGTIPNQSPFYTNAVINKALTLDYMGKKDKAISYTKEIIEKIDKMESKREEEMFFKLHATLADLLRSNSLWTEAQIQYDKVISYQKKQKKEDWKIYYKRGIAFERQGSEYWNFAEQDLIYALSLNPEQPEVLNYLGYSWIEMNKNIEEAGKMLQKAVDQRPDSGYIIDSLGWAYFKLGRYNEALTQLELAAELNPNDPVINDHLGDVYWMVNKHLQARFQWEKALLFDPQEYLIPILEHKLLFGLDS